MKWYYEIKNIFGRFASATSDTYPPDRSGEGTQRVYRVRAKIAPEHQNLGLAEIREIYGTKNDCD